MRRQSGQRYRGLRAHHQRLKTQMTTLQQELAACKEEAERLRRAMDKTQMSYWLLSENARDIVLFIRASDGRIVEANAAAVAAYGYDYPTLLTKTISDLREPATLNVLPEQMQQADADGILFETRHCRSDGSVFPVEVSARGADVAGERLLLSIIRDITERKQAEAALRRGQERLQMVLRAGRMGWWERDLRTSETTWSDTLYDLLGQGAPGNRPSYEQFLQRVHPDDRQKVQDRVRRAIDEGGEYSAEYRLVHPNSGVRWVLEKGRLFYDPADHSQRLVGVSLDLTQRKWVEEGLRESEAILRSFYDNTTLLLGLVEIGADDILHLYDNPATHRFYGLPAAESTTGRWASSLGLPPPAIREWLSRFRESELSGQPVQFEYVHDSPNGPRWLAATVIVIGPGFSGRTRFCYVAEDVTERKRVEIGQQVLAEAGRLLAMSFSVTDRLVELAEIGVKAIAEWCAVNLVEADGTIRLVAAAHREPGKTALIHELAQRFPLDLTIPTRTPEVLRTGEGRLYTDLFEALPPDRSQDPGYRQLLAQLGGQTIIIAPLVARERVLGSITCVSRPGQRYDSEDLALVEELARRAALAVDNVRLYEAEQQARQEAEETVKHNRLAQELRDPIAQTLGNLNLKFELVHSLLDSGQTDAAQATLRELRHVVSETSTLLSKLL
ncbi:MAG: PAS domain S-box protein [Anaerolineae bacterium]|nr:PAS domain S-box protein [Anaerolineae bacterium]